MNRQRKVVITVTYNDLGTIVDTKAEKLDLSAQPNLQQTCNNLATDAISRQAACEYCHEDSDGYVTPLEKNCHAFVRCSPIDGWILSLKYGSWRKDVQIRYCPMCGRRLER